MSDDHKIVPPGAAIDAWVAKLQQEIAGVLGYAENRIEQLTNEVRQLQAEQRALRDRLARQTAGDSAVSPSAQHLDAVREYGRVVEQDFVHIAQQAVSQRSRHPDPEDVARAVASLSRAVFKTSSPSTRTALGMLKGRIRNIPQLEEIIQRGLQVRARAEQTGDDVSWDFRFTSGALPAADQTVWGSCAPDQPVAFVVTPAYRVGGTPYYLQAVYTGNPAPLRGGWV